MATHVNVAIEYQLKVWLRMQEWLRQADVSCYVVYAVLCSVWFQGVCVCVCLCVMRAVCEPGVQSFWWAGVLWHVLLLYRSSRHQAHRVWLRLSPSPFYLLLLKLQSNGLFKLTFSHILLRGIHTADNPCAVCCVESMRVLW